MATINVAGAVSSILLQLVSGDPRNTLPMMSSTTFPEGPEKEMREWQMLWRWPPCTGRESEWKGKGELVGGYYPIILFTS